MKSSTLLVAVIIVAVIVVAGVVYYLTLPGPEPPEVIKVACVLPGSINDHGWNQAWWEGLHEAELELDIEIGYSEAVTVETAGGVFTDYAERGFDLIFCLDYGQVDAAVAAADAYPDVLIAIPEFGMFGKELRANIVLWGEIEAVPPCYYAGILAAGLSKSGIIASSMAIPVPFSIAMQEGYKLGALTYAQENAIPIKNLEQIAGVWEDINLGYEISAAFIDAGADVIFGTGGSGLNIGGIMAAKAAGGVYFIGASGDQRPIAPDVCIASQDNVMYEVIGPLTEMLIDGTLRDTAAASVAAGEHYTVWYDTILVGWDSDMVPVELQTRIESAMAAYEAGTLEIPYITDMQPPLDYTP